MEFFENNFRALSTDQLQGIVHVNSTFNNTHVTVSNMFGEVKLKRSGGLVKKQSKVGNSSKGSAHIALKLGEEVGAMLLDPAYNINMEIVELRIKGMGRGRGSIHKGLLTAGVKIVRIGEKSYLPHNGCRPKKRKRL